MKTLSLYRSQPSPEHAEVSGKIKSGVQTGGLSPECDGETPGLRFLYRTVIGRMILKILVQPSLSRAAGRFLDSKHSVFLIKEYQKKNAISLDGITVPEGGFSSFNSFFSRKRTHTDFSGGPEDLCSPCDAYLSCYRIGEDSSFYIKHSRYSLSDLLQDRELAEGYQGGTAMIFRMTPAHYHRYHYIDDGNVLKEKRIDGVLHCVRPISGERYPVYIRNSREYSLQETAHFGTIVQMEVGALLVGRIRNHRTGGSFCRGEEKGCFEFGGSTIVLLLQKNAAGLLRLPDCTDNGQEISVRLGESIAVSLNSEDKML